MSTTPMIQTIPNGSIVRSLPNGDVFITLPGATIPYLCVKQSKEVQIAIVGEPVPLQLAEAARQYVAQHLTEERPQTK